MLTFQNRDEASSAAAEHITARITDGLAGKPRVTLVVSGGSTPQLCLQQLARADLPWDRVDITLTDERNVPADHPDSNERMVREYLMVENAATGKFVKLNRDMALAPIACTLVGMGADGHFASLFPDSPELGRGLETDEQTINITTPSSPHTRTSMTLVKIASSDSVVLLAFGEAKRRILEAPENYPVDHLIQATSPVIIWAP